MGRTGREAHDVSQARESVERVRRRLADLEAKFEQETARLRTGPDTSPFALEASSIRPRKADITVTRVALTWAPWRVGPDGAAAPLYE